MLSICDICGRHTPPGEGTTTKFSAFVREVHLCTACHTAMVQYELEKWNKEVSRAN
jgi:hypothetical protein